MFTGVYTPFELLYHCMSTHSINKNILNSKNFILNLLIYYYSLILNIYFHTYSKYKLNKSHKNFCLNLLINRSIIVINFKDYFISVLTYDSSCTIIVLTA